jgi:hypothetical protein
VWWLGGGGHCAACWAWGVLRVAANWDSAKLLEALSEGAVTGGARAWGWRDPGGRSMRVLCKLSIAARLLACLPSNETLGPRLHTRRRLLVCYIQYTR